MGAFRPDGSAGLLFCLSLGLLFVALTFDVDFVQGTSAYWRAESEDVTQYIAGLNMYLSRPWQFPLLGFDALNHPAGTLVTFVDGIPLLALVLKAAGAGGQSLINPFGYWVATCFVLQACCVWWIAREFGCRSWAMLIFLAVTLTAWPALMARFGHVSLMSHWILLAAFALYLRARRASFPLAAWSLLLVVAFYVNVYLFVMAGAIYVAATLAAKRLSNWKGLLGLAVPALLLASTLFLTMLPLPPGSGFRDEGFGLYSMNLLAPLVGGSILALDIPVMPGQYEGVNYLGLGVLLALLFLLLFKPRAVLAELLEHRALCVVLGLCATYALSNKVYLSETLLAELRYPGWSEAITAQFRASGRFFWPVGYALVLFAAAMLFRMLPARWFGLSIVVLAAVQWLDVADGRDALADHAQREHGATVDLSTFDTLIDGKVRKAYFYPKYSCGHHANILAFMRYAAQRGLVMNTGYIARYRPDCSDVRAEIEASDPVSAVYVFNTPEYPDGVDALIRGLALTRRLECREAGWATICRAADSAQTTSWPLPARFVPQTPA